MMNTQLVLKVGIVPGAVNEFVMELGSTVREALELAGLSTEGYDFRVDGDLVTNLDSVIPEGTSLLVGAKLIKGNASQLVVKVGVIPGSVNEFVMESGTTVAQAIELASLTSDGYDVRVDGELASVDSVIPSDAKLIILARQIKGNSEPVVLKVGVIPGSVNEFAVEEGSTIEEVLTLANLSSDGYDVRLDGELVDLDDIVEEDSKLVILAKQIKGNN
jgi:putative ubiquitin-RnfH superfamily antitoxin RatB of RatAB toxin-antitoxin module